MLDSQGNEIKLGSLVRFIPQPIEGTDQKTLSYKGKIIAFGKTRKGEPTVEIIALPELTGNMNTMNHGFHIALLSQVKLIKTTAHIRKLEKYKRKRNDE